MTSAHKIFLFLTIAAFGLLTCSKDAMDPIPTIEIVSPLPNAIFSDNFAVEIKASASTGINKVELYLDNIFIGEADLAPYLFTINIYGYNVGTYKIKAIAYSSSGKTSA